MHKLLEGEIICPKCRGKGHLDFLNNDLEISDGFKLCRKCDGTGYIDWVENVIGKRPIKIWESAYRKKIIREG